MVLSAASSFVFGAVPEDHVEDRSFKAWSISVEPVAELSWVDTGCPSSANRADEIRRITLCSATIGQLTRTRTAQEAGARLTDSGGLLDSQLLPLLYHFGRYVQSELIAPSPHRLTSGILTLLVLPVRNRQKILMARPLDHKLTILLRARRPLFPLHALQPLPLPSFRSAHTGMLLDRLAQRGWSARPRLVFRVFLLVAALLALLLGISLLGKRRHWLILDIERCRCAHKVWGYDDAGGGRLQGRVVVGLDRRDAICWIGADHRAKQVLHVCQKRQRAVEDIMLIGHTVRHEPLTDPYSLLGTFMVDHELVGSIELLLFVRFKRCPPN